MRYIKSLTIALLALALAGISAHAQNSPAVPKPGSEVEKLKYFLGDWKQEGSIAASHNPNAGKYTGTFHNVMALGGFYVETHSTDKTGMGQWTTTAFRGYDANEKVYTYNEFDSTGGHTVAKGTLEGDTWTWTSESKMGDKTMNGRYTEKITSPSTYDFKFESSMDGGKTWTTSLEGKATKVGGAAVAATKPAAVEKASGTAAKPKGGDAKAPK